MTLLKIRPDPSMVRASAAFLAFLAATLPLRSQPTPSREYIRLGGRVIAIENYLTRTTINPNETVHLTSPVNVTWSIQPTANGSLQNVTATSVDYHPPALLATAAPVTDTVIATPTTGQSTNTVIQTRPALCDKVGSTLTCGTAKTYYSSSGTGTLTVTSPGPWTVSSPSWIQTSFVTSPDGNGDITYTFSASSLPQTGQITITGGNPTPLAYTISLANTAITIDSLPSSRNPVSYSDTISLHATLTGSSTLSWQATGGSFSSTTSNPTTYTAPTTGSSVTITATTTPTGSNSVTVPVVPVVCDSSVPNCSSKNFAYTAGNGTLTVTKGGPWTIASNVQWLHLPAQTAYTDNQSVAYNVDANNSTTTRTATVTVTWTGGSATFTVTQDAVPAFTINPPARNPIGPSETAQFTVTGGLTATWLVINGSPGSIGATSGLYTAPTASAVTSPTAVTIQATVNSVNSTTQLTVQPAICQLGGNCSTSVVVPNTSGNYGLIVTKSPTAGLWTAQSDQAQSDQSWLTVGTGSNYSASYSGTGDVALGYSTGAGVSNARTGHITFTGSLAGNIFTVTQSGATTPCPTAYDLLPHTVFVPVGSGYTFQVSAGPTQPDATVGWSLNPAIGSIAPSPSTTYWGIYTAPPALSTEQFPTVTAQYNSATCGNHTLTSSLDVSPQPNPASFTFTPPSTPVSANVQASFSLTAVSHTPLIPHTIMEFAIADGSSGSTPNIPNSCDFVIHGALTGDGSGNYVFLTSNEGFSTIGPGAFGAIGPTGYTTLPNSQCTLLTQASAGSGGYSNDASTYFLNPILITFTPAFTGIKKIYGRITGTDGSVLDPWTFVGYLTIGNPDLTITSSHSSNFTQGQTGATYTLTVGNIGNGSSSGAVTVTDTLPTGLTASAISGTGWSCTLSTLTCTRSDALSATATYPPITVTVNVAANAAASVTNSVSVSGGGESNTANDTGTDPTTITNTVDLVLSGLTFITGPTALFHATNSITATTVVINNTASDSGSVTFQAGSVIKLEPGFHALAGTPAQTFHAFIQ